MAKSAMYYIDNYKIEIVNTFFGKEKVLLNGVKVSEKRGNVRAAHTFVIGRNQYNIALNDSYPNKDSNRFEIKKNSVPLSLVNLLPKTSTQLLLILIVMGLGIGFMIGRLLFDYVWPVLNI